MSLIDKEKLINAMNTRAEEECLEFRDIRNMVEFAPTVNAIPIPEGATNGDMFKAMFPNAQIDYHEKSDLVDDYVTVFIKGCDTCQDYSYDWWNAPYKKESEEHK